MTDFRRSRSPSGSSRDRAIVAARTTVSRGRRHVVAPIVLAAHAGALVAIVPPCDAQVRVRVVAQTGQQAPGAEAGVTFLGFGSMVMNDRGETAFTAHLVGPGVNAGTFVGVWSEYAGSLGKLIRSGDPTPGAPDGRLISMGVGDLEYFNCPKFNDGRAAFVGMYGPGGGQLPTGSGVWIGVPGNLRRIADLGDHAPGLPPGVNFGEPQQNCCVFSIDSSERLGRLVIRGRFNGPGVTISGGPTNPDNLGLWLYDGADLQFLWRLRDPLPDGSNRNFVFASSLIADDENPFLVTSNITPSFVFSETLWRHSAGALTKLIESGDPAPARPPGWTLDDSFYLKRAMIGERLDIALTATQGSGGSQIFQSSAYRRSPSGWTLLARVGEQAPGAAPGVTFYTVDALGNARGDVLLSGRLIGPGLPPINESVNDGLWFRRGPTTSVLARQGSPVPFLPAAVWGRPESPSVLTFPRADINDIGEVAFLGYIRGPGVTELNSLVLCVATGGNSPRLLLRSGDIMTVGGVQRTIRTFNIAEDQRGPNRMINGRGQIPVRLRFTDNTQSLVVLSGPPACPGDVTGDGRVDFLDLVSIINDYGRTSGPIVGDANLDGVCDFVDLSLLLGSFGADCTVQP